jgi:hypothetical protein
MEVVSWAILWSLILVVAITDVDYTPSNLTVLSLRHFKQYEICTSFLNDEYSGVMLPALVNRYYVIIVSQHTDLIANSLVCYTQEQ